MPYRWTTERSAQQLVLWPHRSLPRRGFAVVMLTFFTLLTFPLYGVLGTAVLWGLLPFGLAALAGLWWALERSYRSGDITETLTLDPTTTRLTRRDPSGAIRDWTCNTHWARAEIHVTGGPVPHYVTLTGNGRRAEIGAFLSEDERKSLFTDLNDALNRHRNLIQEPRPQD